MTQELPAGSRRRGRRRIAGLIAVAAVGGALVLASDRGEAEEGRAAWLPAADDFSRSDAEIAGQLLASVQGANPVVCAAVDRTFSAGYWGSASLEPDALAPAEAAETARWIGKRKLDRAVLDVARPGLASTDACTRRIAIRILGNVGTGGLDRALAAELASTAPATRIAAILVLGYTGDAAYSALMTGLLERDQNADIRRAAAWALGRIHG